MVRAQDQDPGGSGETAKVTEIFPAEDNAGVKSSGIQQFADSGLSG